MINWEIKPFADGYAIYKDGAYQMWCYDRKYAETRLEMMMQGLEKA